VAQLLNQSRGNSPLATSIEVADGFYSRLMGLMFKPSLTPNTGLWFHGCSSIHTCFMRFAIDVIYVDKNLKVKRVYESLKPWRMTRFVSGADSVFELPAGTVKEREVRIGDQLYVGN
jgi:uncharacterized membrane protein (UPF0127 family)